MKSIEARFKEEQRKQPALSDFIAFSMAVENQHFSRKTVLKGFRELVDKEDYEKNDKPELINNLMDVTNGVEEG